MGKGRYGNDKGKREKEKYQREMKYKRNREQIQ